MSQSTINKVQQTQQNELQELQNLISVCGICNRNKPHLYVCNFNQCPQSKRILCVRCGNFSHGDEGYYHEFDINADYMEEVKVDLVAAIQNNAQNTEIIKGNVQLVRHMAESLEEKKNAPNRNKFEIVATYLPQAVHTLDVVNNWVRNDDYFLKAFGKLSAAIKSGKIKEFGTGMKTVLFDVGDNMLEATEACKEGAVIAAVAVFTFELAVHTYKWMNGDISFKTYGKRILSSAAMGVGAAVGNVGGAAIGGAIGTFLLPGVGTSIGSALGGLLGSIFVGIKAKQSIEDISYFSGKNEQAIRHALIKEALDRFGFTWKDLTNSDIFNERSIAQRYRVRAKESHPDRTGGSQDAFQKLSAQLSVLVAMLEQ
eukprot:887587_1